MNKTLSPTGMNAGLATRLVVRVALAAVLAICDATLLTAQNAWDAILNIDPYPSPYYSDWDNNPNIASLTVINPGAARQVRIHFNVTNRANKIVLSGSSDPQSIGARATVVFDNPYDVAGSSHHDEEEERIASRTGRLREGAYTACTVVADLSGFSLAESCAPFTIVYPDPPLLLTPENRDVITQTDPLFQWTPVQVPIDFQLSYVLRVVEVLNGQTPQEALRSNIPHFQSMDGQFPSLRYPIDARPFEVGKQYAWTVQVLDQNGYTAAANDGRSEIWTFAYGERPPETQIASTMLNVRNLRDGTGTPADTVRGLSSICANWDANVGGDIDFPLQTPFAFPLLTKVRASLVRQVQDDSDGRRIWALYGNNDKHTVLLFGDCSGLETKERWIAVRKTDDTQELRGWLPADTTVNTEAPGPTLKFGVAVFSLREETIGGAEALMPVQEFLEGREIDIKPGINLFGVLDAKYLKIWPVLEALGHDAQTAEVELQGFAGLNLNASVEFRGGNEERTRALTATAEFITLRAMWPERQLRVGPFKTLRTGIEVSFGDSLGAGFKRDLTKGDTIGTSTTDWSHHIALKLLVEALSHDSITWNGALEFDWNLSDDEGRCVSCAAPTLRLTTNHRWQPFDGAEIALGNPELAIGINDGLKAALWHRDADSLHADITLRGSLIVHDEDIAKAAVTFGRHAANAESMERTAARIRAAQVLDSLALVQIQKAVERGDDAAANAWRQKHRDHVTDIGNWKNQLHADSLKVARARHDNESKAPAAGSDKGWYWRASLTLGNMSLVNLIDLTSNVTRAIASGLRRP